MAWKKQGLVEPGTWKIGFIQIRFYRDGKRRWRWAIQTPRWLRIRRKKV